MNDDEVMRLKILISAHTSTSFIECDLLFLKEFFGYDKYIGDKIKAENDSFESMSRSLTG